MNQFIPVLLFLLPCFVFAQASDYLITKEDSTLYGKIEQSNLLLNNSAITFRDKQGNTKTYNPSEVVEWRKDGLVYRTKPYPFKRKEPVLTFMQLISESTSGVNVYEYSSRFNSRGTTDLFLEQAGTLTKVRFGRFRKQMIEYFKDYPEITQLVENREVKRGDLLTLVAEYNELMVEKKVGYDKAPFGVKKEKKRQLWDFNDMLLSTDEAAKKYMAAIKEATKDILDKKIRAIEIDYGIGLSFFEQNKYDEALPYLKSAYEAIDSEQINSDKLPRIASMLATIYFSQRKYNLAINYNSNALLLWKNGFTSSDAFYLHNSYLTQGKIIQALRASASNISWYEMTVGDSRKDWAEQLRIRNLEPIVHTNKSDKSIDYNLALLFYKYAEEVLSRLPQKKQIPKKIELNILIGKLYFEAGDYTLSQTYYEKALKIINQHYKENNTHPQKGEIERTLSEIYLANQLYSEALNYIDQAQHSQVGAEIAIDHSLLDNIYEIPFPLELLNSITTKGIILYEQNKLNPSEVELKEVLAHYAIATELLYKLRATQRGDASKYQLGNITHRLSQHAVKICNTLFLKTKNKEYLHEAFLYAELSKSAVLFETIHNLKSMEVAGIPRNLTVMENGYKVQISYLKGEIFYELQQGKYANKERIEKLQSKVESISEEHNALLKKLERNYPEYYNLKYSNKSVTLVQLQEVLKPDEVFLEYVVTDTFVYVLAITKQAIKSQFTSLSRPLPYTVKKLQHALRNNKADLYAIHGNALYESVIGGLTSFIKGKKLIVAADAELNYIPFGVLPTNQPQLKSTGASIYGQVHFLIEDHPIYYNYSAGMFLLGKKTVHHKKSSKKISTWAPNFTSMEAIIKDKGIGEKLRPLPGAQQEAQHIADMFGSHAYINAAASELQFKSKAEQYSVLHIATHGVLNDLDPMFSSLILKNEGAEDGILHAFELYNMQLNADLAVLSACNSGMGKLAKGEGIFSIARGFSYAGIPNIIMSKWSVSDWSTELLMKEFYRNLKTGMPIDEALQQAKIKYLNDNRDNPQLLAPFYWGGFVLSGNSTPINSLKDSPWDYLWYVLGFLTLSLLALGFIKRKSQKLP